MVITGLRQGQKRTSLQCRPCRYDDSVVREQEHVMNRSTVCTHTTTSRIAGCRELQDHVSKERTKIPVLVILQIPALTVHLWGM